MSEVAIWTDSEGRVSQKHYEPERIDTSTATVVTEESKIPDEPDTQPWVEARMRYDGSDFYWVKKDPFEGLDFTDSQKQELYKAFRGNNIRAARDIVEAALKK